MILVAAILPVLGACVPQSWNTSRSLELERQQILERWSERRRLARVNANWSVDCTTDVVTNLRRCYASTSGQPRGALVVRYYNDEGPFVWVGAHSDRRLTPMVRFDNDAEPHRIAFRGDWSTERPDTKIVERLMTATTAVARYYDQPNDVSRTMTLQVAGFPEAHARLMELVGGAVSPWETVNQ